MPHPVAKPFDGALDRAIGNAPFLAGLIDREAALVEALRNGHWRDDQPADETLPVAQRLRLARRRAALRIAIADLAGVFDFAEVTAALTDFADFALDAAIRAAIEERIPGAPPAGFVALALGKQGSRELNYSSDIDLILLFDPATLPCRPREEPHDAAVRIARRVVEILQARDADGYVLRVDLRLRPSPEITPVALAVDAAISYYEALALPWERAAFIRARSVAGDVALGTRFLAAIRPFIWRRALDFGAIGEIRAISHRIRSHHAQGQSFGAGFDLKRGRGGIREIEFFAQIHQLIHGGREPGIRAPATLDALAQLAAHGLIDEDDARALSRAYVALRTIEHRVQMIEDRQTHLLPSGGALDGVARLHGLKRGDDLLDLLRPHVERVAQTYDSLDADGKAALPADVARLTASLSDNGFVDAVAATQRVMRWRAGTYPALRSAAARAALEAVLPSLAAALGKAADPNGAINRLDQILERLPSVVNFFRLLEAQPPLAKLLGAILCHAPPLAEALGRRPELFDVLIDASALAPVGEVDALLAEMTRHEAGDDYQMLLDHVRKVVGEKRFALGTQIVAAVSDPVEVGRGYARVAEAAVQALGAATIQEFQRRHGTVPDSEFVILALGRFGGGVLTHESDLDLIYLFTGEYRAESTGAQPLGAVTYYNRLAQRVTAALSVPTATGRLYDVDTRLRPSGGQGPLVVSVEGFARYQQQDAWTWEHMALTRARPILGSAMARAQVMAVVRDVLAGNRPDRDIARDAVAMRADISAHKPPKGPLDAKLLPGGLVDLEFAVHVTQLEARASFHPDMTKAIDALADAGLLPGHARNAHDYLTGLLIALRLLAPALEPPAPATRDLIATVMQMPDWDAVVARAERARQEIAAIWLAVRERSK